MSKTSASGMWCATASTSATVTLLPCAYAEILAISGMSLFISSPLTLMSRCAAGSSISFPSAAKRRTIQRMSCDPSCAENLSSLHSGRNALYSFKRLSGSNSDDSVNTTVQ